MTSQGENRLFGLALAGGKSTRMGMDKARISYHGLPQKDHLFQLLGRSCDKVFISISKEAEPADYNNPIVDAFGLETPLDGILSAFQKHPHIAWLTVPIDMPFVDDHTIQFLIDHRDTGKVATCFYDTSGKLPEPLLTLWEPKSKDLLLEFYGDGKLSPREFLK
ncbi:MAG: NTP transferase domain-containing protein, partial [Cyclobacteriaceae bacterium]